MTTPSDSAPQQPHSYWEAPKQEAGPAPGVKFAGYGGRLVAYILDGLIVGVISLAIFTLGSVAVVGSSGVNSFNENGVPSSVSPAAWGLFSLSFLATLVITLAYFPFFWVRSGQTPGMRPFGLYVVRDADGGRITTGQAILRLVGMWVSAIPFYLGFIWIFIDARRRGWHDLIAGTVVVERTPQQ